MMVLRMHKSHGGRTGSQQPEVELPLQRIFNSNFEVQDLTYGSSLRCV